MSAALKIFDEYFGGRTTERAAARELRLVSERTTARDIIRQRVLAEIDEIRLKEATDRARLSATRSWLIQFDDTSAEARLNRAFVGSRKPKIIDFDVEFAKALNGFDKQRYIMLFDDIQIETLDQTISLMPNSEVVFLYLTPLKGG